MLCTWKRILGLILIAGLFACNDEKRIIPVEDFFSTPERTNFRMSPDGKYISFLGQHNKQKNIFLIHLDDGCEETRLTSESDAEITSYFWAQNDELVFRKGRWHTDSLHVFIVNRDSKDARRLLPLSDLKMRWINYYGQKNNELLVSLNQRDSAIFDVYRLNTGTGKKKLIAINPGNVIRWYADTDGKLRLALASDSARETILYRETEKDEFRPVVSNSFRTTIKPLGFSGKEKHKIYALSNINRDKLALVEFDLTTGKEANVIYDHPDVDMDNLGYMHDKGEMAYASFTTWKQQRHFLNEQTKRVFDNINKKLEGYELVILDRDTARRRFIVSSYTDKNPGATYYYDIVTDDLIKLADNNPALKDRDLAEMKPIAYQSRDGREIQGYLTMPVHAKGKKVPLIVYPHNGPGDRDVWRFDPEVQFLANRGYAVFQVNYRGSTGFGKEFWTAGFKEWGGKIQDDITDGVHWLIEEGIADSDRIGIYGVGFGGYSALQGACFRSDLYACAASYSGFTNLFTYLREIPPRLKPYLQMYYEIIGNPEQESELIKAMSPVFHAENINIPVFIAQGGRDSWSTVNETNQFVRKLKKRKIPITYILREEEGRYFLNEENRIHFYRELGNFFDRHLKK